MQFDINGVKWGLERIRSTDKRLMRSDGVYTLGVTDWNVKKIFISDAVYGKMYERILCHELTHSVCFSYNIYLPVQLEERLCNFMEDHGKEIIYLLDDLLQTMDRRVFA